MIHKAAFILAAAALMASPAIAQTPLRSTPPDPFKFLSAAEVDALTANPGSGGKFAFQGDHENSYVEYASRTDAGNQAEVHAHWTHYIHILSGEATLVYGGTVTNPRDTGPGQVRGSGITGGDSKPVHTGDYMQIPAGMPHLFTVAAGKSLHYVVFNARQ